MAGFGEWTTCLIIGSALFLVYLSDFASQVESAISLMVHLSILCLLLVLVFILLRTTGFDRRIPWLSGVFDSISVKLSITVKGPTASEESNFGDWAPRLGLLSGLLFGCLGYFFSPAVSAGLTAAAMGGLISQSPAPVLDSISKRAKDFLSGVSKVVRNHWGKLAAAAGATFLALRHSDLLRQAIEYLKLIYKHRRLIFWVLFLVLLVWMYLRYLSSQDSSCSWSTCPLLLCLVLVYVSLDRLRAGLDYVGL